jgi:hypothetical protein
MKHILIMAVAASAALPASAHAQEAFLGAYTHGVDTPFTLETGEDGLDVVAGYRFNRITALSAIGSPAPYVVALLNTGGDTSFAGVGLGWTLGKGPVYLRPGVGLVVHDGPEYRVNPATRMRTDLGSRVLFEPEIAIGYRIDDRVSVEASWMHISHARLFDSQQNPGIDMMGARLNYRFGR